MIPSYFDVRRRGCSRPTTHQNSFSRSFEKIIYDLEGTSRQTSGPTVDGLRVRAGASLRDAMEIVEIGIDHGREGYIAKMHTILRFISSGSVHPNAIDDDVISRSIFLHRQ